MNPDYSIPVATILPAVPNAMEMPQYFEPLEIIAQPCFTSKLRYRSDYDSNKTRRGVLRSRNNPNYRSPAIRIPQMYLDVTQNYYIRVSLVTVINEQTNCRYIHPYELEDINVAERNNRPDNCVCFPIEPEDKDGIKSFPNLRIVRKRAMDLKNHGNLRVFDSQNVLTTPQLSGAKDTIGEFNLNRSQLAFTLGREIIVDGNLALVFYTCTTQFSDEMVEILGQESDTNAASTKSTTRRCRTSTSSTCQIYKYAPQSGYTFRNDEVLIFLTNKLRPDRYGELQVIFEYDTPTNSWSESVLDLEVKDQMVSFRTPLFPFPIDRSTPVNIVLKQTRRTFEPLQFSYIPITECPRCEQNVTTNPNPVAETNPNKRDISHVYDEENDDTAYAANPDPDLSSPSGMLNSEWF